MSKAPINDEQIETLDRLLSLRAVPHGGLGIEGLDGYFSAIVVGPGEHSAAALFDQLWGPQAPRWESDADRQEALSLVEALWRTTEKRLTCDTVDMPSELLPIWWLPDDPAAEHPDDNEIGAAWAEGFRFGMELEAEGWQDWIDRHDWLGDAVGLIDDLEVGMTFEDDGETERPLRYPERLQYYGMLPDLLQDLQRHRLQELSPREPVRSAALPGRNDPCPCGSGRKYKKCCGAGH